MAQEYGDMLSPVKVGPITMRNRIFFAAHAARFLPLNAGVNDQGIAYYEALELSEQMGDSEGQALAHYQLALLYQLFENPEEAIQHVQAAMNAYQRLGNTSQCEDLQKLLQELQK